MSAAIERTKMIKPTHSGVAACLERSHARDNLADMKCRKQTSL